MRSLKLPFFQPLGFPLFFFDDEKGRFVVRLVDCVAPGGALKPGHPLMKVGRLFHGDMLTWVIPRHLPLSALFGTVGDMSAYSAAKAVDDAGPVTECVWKHYLHYAFTSIIKLDTNVDASFKSHSNTKSNEEDASKSMPSLNLLDLNCI